MSRRDISLTEFEVTVSNKEYHVTVNTTDNDLRSKIAVRDNGQWVPVFCLSDEVCCILAMEISAFVYGDFKYLM